ncbi:MAG: outer membrane protein transport protein [Candidatus Zixiibacteriota bacterium]
MRKRLFFPGLFLLLFVMLCCSDGYSQGYGVVDEAAAGNFFVVGARALGMGGAYTAVANDATALVYNPAGLARVIRIEFSGGLTHQRINNKTDLGVGFNDGRLQNNTRFGSGNLVLPVPTYRGSLVLAFGVNRVKSFDQAMQFSSNLHGSDEKGVETESGGIYLWSFGAAVDVSPNISVGGAINYWNGKDNYTWLYEKLVDQFSIRYNDAIKDRYSGFNLKLGVRTQPNKLLTVGATIESPVTFTIKEDWSQATGSELVYGNSEYKITFPFSLGAGVAFNLNNLTVAGDVNYTDWTQMEYKRLEDIANANRLIQDTYKATLRYHLGAEFLIPRISTTLRAGFFRNPLPYKSEWVKKDREFFTTGVGFLIDQVMTLDIAWAYGSWELKNFTPGLTEKYTVNQIFVSTAYRF